MKLLVIAAGYATRLYSRADVFTWRVPGEWYDIGSAETLREADSRFLHN